MNIHEYQAKAVLRAFAAPVSNGRAAFTPDEAEAAAQGARRPALGRQIADPRRRPRQGQVQGGVGRRKGRRAARQVGRRGQAIRRADARRDAGDRADRARRQAGQPALYRGRLRDRQGILSVAAGRSHRRRASPSSSRPRAASTSRTSRTTRRRRSSHFSVDPATGIMPHHGRTAAQRARAHRRSRQAMRSAGDQALRRLRRQGHVDAGDQPAGRHHERPAQGARRQGFVRRQRALSAIPTSSPCATRPRRTPRRSRPRKLRSQLCRARRHDRLHGQRRRPRDGDDGHHQALRREPGQLPRRRRRRLQGEGDGGVQDHHRRPQREGHPGQHLRRHHALRRDRRRA